MSHLSIPKRGDCREIVKEPESVRTTSFRLKGMHRSSLEIQDR